jgi:hypothetical protein
MTCRDLLFATLCGLLATPSAWGCSDATNTSPLTQLDVLQDSVMGASDSTDTQILADGGVYGGVDGEVSDGSNPIPADAMTKDTTGQDVQKPQGFGLDFDEDGVDDLSDNCVFGANPEQIDTDGDGEGDLCDADVDGDKVPNAADNWPKDDALPGVSAPSLIYAHSAQTLYTFEPSTATLTLIGDFQWPPGTSGEAPIMVDIALDEYGVLYGASLVDIFICHPSTAACNILGAAPTPFSGLTFVSKGIMNTEQDVLIATTTDGGWHQITLTDKQISLKTLGNHGELYAFDGDAFSVQGMGTYVSARAHGSNIQFLGKVNPWTGEILDTVGELSGYDSVHGLAGWADQILVFDGNGAILRVPLNTGLLEIATETETSWAGAAVRSKL